MPHWFNHDEFANAMLAEMVAMVINFILIVLLFEWFKKRVEKSIEDKRRGIVRQSVRLTLEWHLRNLDTAAHEAARTLSSYFDVCKDLKRNGDAIKPPPPAVEDSLKAIVEIRRELLHDLAAWSSQMDDSTKGAWEAVLCHIDRLLKVWSVKHVVNPSSATFGVKWDEIDKDDFLKSLPKALMVAQQTKLVVIEISGSLAFASSCSRKEGDKELLEAAKKVTNLTA